METIQAENIFYCNHCTEEISADARFCTKCGTSQKIIVKDDYQVKKIVWLLAIFYSIEFSVCAVSNFTETLIGIKYILIFDAIMVLNALVFTSLIWQKVKPALKWPHFSILRLSIYIVIAVAVSLFVQWSIGLLNRHLFENDISYYYYFSLTDHPMLFMILLMAVQPAIIEELSYRGFMYGALSKILDYRQVIFITSFAFSLIHLSFLSFFWLMPFALMLAHIRKREETIWYGVIIHFVFNATACLNDYYEII